MSESVPNHSLGYFLEPIFKYAVLTILSPLFILLAMIGSYLHPKR
jgi:hypothetical protein